MSSSNLNQSRLRILQGLMAICLLSMIGVYIADGHSIVAAIIGGGTFGGFAFIPLAVMLVIYWGIGSPLHDQD